MGELGEGEDGVAVETEGVEGRWRVGCWWRERGKGQADVLLGGGEEVRMEYFKDWWKSKGSF